MTRTYNRVPYSVPLPSKNDIKDYFFNHYNWKGVNDDRNFLSVDQETFSDANNVYIDSEGLLKSRPSQKLKIVNYKEDNIVHTLSDIVNVWTFEYVTVYQSVNDDIYYLTFINDKFENNLQVALVYTDEEDDLQSYKDVTLIVENQKIFVFSEYSFDYYDMVENTYDSADEFIHIPVTSIVVNGIPTDVDVESKNELTNSYYTKYIFDSIADNYSFSNFVDKTVTVVIDNESFEITFKSHNNLVFFSKYFSISSNNFISGVSNDTPLIINPDETVIKTQRFPGISISNNRSIILSSVEIINNKYVWKYYYSTNQIVFEELPYLENTICQGYITKDGNNAVVFKKDGPYIYSLVNYLYLEQYDTNVKEFTVWTNLLKNCNETTYNSYSVNIYNENNFAQSVSADFANSTDFSITFCQDSVKTLTNISSVNGVMTRNIIFGNATTITPTDASTFVDSPSTSASGDSIYDNFVWGGGGYVGTIIQFPSNYSRVHTFSYNEGDITINYRIKFYLSSVIDRVDYYLDYVLNTTITGNLPGGLSGSYSGNFLSGAYGQEATVVITNELFQFSLSATLEDNAEIFAYQDTTLSITPLTSTLAAEAVSNGQLNFLLNNTITKYYLYNDAGTPKYKAAVLFDCGTSYADANPYLQTCVYSIINGSGTIRIINYTTQEYPANHYTGWNEILSLTSDLKINSDSIYYIDGNQGYIYVYTIYDNGSPTVTATLYEAQNRNTVFYCKLSQDSGYAITSIGLFPYRSYPAGQDYEYAPLLEEQNIIPLVYLDAAYMFNDNFVYTLGNKVEILEKTELDNNYIVPDVYTKSESYYFGIDNILYISKNYLDLADNTKIEWYFPKINTQVFDFDITNVHPISNTEVAIFFEHFINYVAWDNDASVYRYYKSKIQAGCKKGCDVLTSFDGKYIIFTSDRGLVGMTYQEFMATTEQALVYLSDIIYNLYHAYITDENSLNEIKLYKYSYYIFVYKQDSKYGFIFDVRNNSWWPITSVHNNATIVTKDNKLLLLLDNKVYTLDTKEIAYYDYDGNEHKIPWHLQSQKLYLGAINYYKHIVNLTFISAHDKKVFEEFSYNIDHMDFKLQVNNYRKRIDGNIDSDDYTTINYTVESARTFVQRLNYSKVNEFQYLLSSNEDNAINLPLSLGSVTVKYKIGTQMR